MSICEGGLLKISGVPKHILDILHTEVDNWNYINDRYKFDKAFGKFKSKFYHVGNISHNISYPIQLTPVIDWIQQLAGSNQKIVRCFLNLMEPHQSFHLHVDTLKVHVLAKRFHIPVILGEGSNYYTYTETNSGTWKESVHHMEYGYLYQLDNIRPHTVKNKNSYRINFICDVINADLISEDLIKNDSQQLKTMQTIFNTGLIIDPVCL
jgi:hypothetical protein